MEYMLAIYLLLMQGFLTGRSNPAQTVQGNYDYQKAYLEQGVLPGGQARQPSKRPIYRRFN